MDAHEHVLRPVDVALDERDVVLARQHLLVGDGLEDAVRGGEPDGGDALDELLVAAAVLDQVGDRDHLEAVELAVADQVLDPRHRAVLVHDLADDAGRREAREPRQVDRRLGLARALEHAAGRARSGKTWPGWTRSYAVEVGSIATWIVRARSWAEMPVETPSRASTETVNAVPKGVSFWSVIWRSPSSSHRSGVRQRQIRPRACVAMKFTASGVTNCAAIVRSPSFSRSSSSTTTTNRPARISSIASSTDEKTVLGASALIVSSYPELSECVSRSGSSGCQPRLEQALDVLREDVDLEVDALARATRRRERRLGERVRDQRDAECIVVQLRDRQRDALDRDRALLDAVAERSRGRPRR